MRDMELKVWVDGIQRIVCGVTELTTCQEVVIALAQAIGRTGRYTLIEKWRETERHLAPHDHPVVSLNKWGQYANDVQLVLERTSLSPGEWSASEPPTLSPEYYTRRHQNLSPLAKLRPLATDGIKRCESKRNSMTFSGSAKGLREIFGKSRDPGRGRCATPGPVAQELGRLVQLQKKKLQSLEQQLHNCEQEIQWQLLSEKEEEELQLLERRVQQTEAEVQEQKFWENELWMEQENERQLSERLQRLRSRVQECETQLAEYLAQIRCMEARLQAEQLRTEAGEEDVWVQMEKVSSELEAQVQQAVRLESSCRAVELAVGQFNLQLQRKEQELEELTKELRHVNLQQFIQQTGTKVSVTPAELTEDETSTDLELSASLKNVVSSRRLSSDVQNKSLTSTLHPDGIYV